MDPKSRRSWNATEKLRILEEGRQGGEAISVVCRRHRISPTLFYQWERQAKEGALQALRPQQRGPKMAATEPLEQEIQRLRNALVEVTLENLALKRGPAA
jgi:transposase